MEPGPDRDASSPQGKVASVRSILALTVLAACLTLVGIRKSLPFGAENDEAVFVRASARIASSQNPNPAWFGHPGSTFIYPLALLYAAPSAVFPGRSFLRVDPDLFTGYAPRHAGFYLTARLLAAAYFIASIPLVYLIGRRSFSDRAALAGAWLFMTAPLAVSYAQIARTDSAATFFGLLALLALLRLSEAPVLEKAALGGVTVGLAVASRYFMVALVPVLVLASTEAFRPRRLLRPARRWLTVSAALTACAAAFILTTPYLFLDFDTAREHLGLEMAKTHLGADGLSPVGNLGWYLLSAFPADLSWPQLAAAVLGLVLIARTRLLGPLLLAAFAATFLAAISLSYLHWHRWTIPVIPVLCLFAAHGVDAVVASTARRFPVPRAAVRALFVFLILLLSARPLYQLARHDAQQTSTTRVRARNWLLRNVAPGTRIVQEEYGPQLSGTDFEVGERYSLAANRPLRRYYEEGYRYLIVSSALYERYLAEPERYRDESQFYAQLFDGGRLLAEFQPPPHPPILPHSLARDCFCSLSQTRGEPTIRIYRLEAEQFE
jgi:uncharacterized integral membrane protein